MDKQELNALLFHLEQAQCCMDMAVIEDNLSENMKQVYDHVNEAKYFALKESLYNFSYLNLKKIKEC